MPLLTRRNAPKLLTRINGKQHATQDDYSDVLPTPPTSNSTASSASHARSIDVEEDITRDPESSDEEQHVAPQLDGPVGFKRPKQVSDALRALPTPATFKKPTSSSPASLASKRSNGSEGNSSDAEDTIFSSQGSKKQRTSYAGNIHAVPMKSRLKPQVYGKATKTRSPKRDSGASFKQVNRQKSAQAPPAPIFQAAKGADMFQFKGKDAEPQFKAPRTSGEVSHSRSPSLSSLSSAPSSPGVEEIQNFDLPAAQPYCPTIECSICGHNVDLFLKQEFEDEFAPGKHMSYKWQQRFCRFHKQHDARQVWKERGYPDIDWDDLEKRMLRFNAHLERVIDGTKSSHYRRELAERLKGRPKTTLQAVTAKDTKSGVQVGYYGPRGDKVM